MTKMDVDGTTGIHFEEDIITEILSRLPVKSLFRFKCVIRSWMTLISKPYFVKKHHNHSKNNQNSQKNCLLTEKLSSFYQYDPSLALASLSSVQLVEDVQQVDWPFTGNVKSCKMYCYDGLALMGVSKYNYFLNMRLWLWNPSTRESIVLPRTRFSHGIDFTCGLGYDSTSNDYKIFKLNGDRSHNEILALKSGSWRKIDKHTAGIYPVWRSTMDSPAFLHDAFHWVCSLKKSVVSFNISNEVYAELPMPDVRFVISRQ
ncbi:putative F-box protein At3g16210 [Solanum stenotomum]|uniref:putative F-box protein At3g16210 n=1 Tax=Solanum stenotomum TaxID=172797 RepID=UPI0020D10B10|nr:putative F-box protein At3g16210 [Solanum stenotomum]